MSLCSMCERAPATTTWGLPVCQPCADALDQTQADLKQMEAEDPHLAELGRRVEDSFSEWLEARGTTDPGGQP